MFFSLAGHIRCVLRRSKCAHIRNTSACMFVCMYGYICRVARAIITKSYTVPCENMCTHTHTEPHTAQKSHVVIVSNKLSAAPVFTEQLHTQLCVVRFSLSQLNAFRLRTLHSLGSACWFEQIEPKTVWCLYGSVAGTLKEGKQEQERHTSRVKNAPILPTVQHSLSDSLCTEYKFIERLFWTAVWYQSLTRLVVLLRANELTTYSTCTFFK